MNTSEAPQTTMTLDLEAPAAEITRLAEAVRDDQLGGRTPCPEMDVAGLLAHLIGLSVAFTDAAAKVDGPTTSTPPGPAVLPPDWRTQLPLRTTELARAWRDPGAWTGMARAGGVEMPADVTAAVANNELVVHGWDLARSIGETYRPAEANLAASWQMVSGTPDEPGARKGLFGPVVPVPEDAPLLDRVLGGAGRDPGWSPAP